MQTFATIAFVVLLWGSTTALIFYLDSLPRRTFKWSMAGATVALLASFIAMSKYQDAATLAVCASFAAAFIAWGWLEMSLYMGYVTGPRKHRCAKGCSGPTHFRHAVEANLWHEIAIIVCALIIWLTGNTTAFWTFVMLWLMHLSARLNVFLGVRNVSEEFVPAHMDVLKGFLRRRSMNALFPFSCAALVLLIYWHSSQPQTISSTLAATLATIGLVEHILLMLPLPVERLWHWAQARKSHARKLTPPMGA